MGTMRLIQALALLALSLACSSVWPQSLLPGPGLRLVVGFPPGGATDTLARLQAQKLSTQMGNTILVENKPGANGNIAAEYVARAHADGNTLLFQTSTLMLGKAFGERLSFDLFADFAPVALVASSPQVLYIHPSVAAATAVEFIAHLRANPGKLAYGSSGTGSTTHLASLLFLQANGLTALHVPYKGSPQVMVDLVAGRIQFTMQGITSGLPLLKDRRLRALAVAGLKRSALLPDIPTLAESAMPGFEVGAWYGIMAPARTPPSMVRQLNGEINRTLKDPALVARLVQENAEPFIATSEEFAAYLKSEVERWSKVIKAANIKPD